MTSRIESNIDTLSVARAAGQYLIPPIFGLLCVFFLTGVLKRVRVWLSAIKMVLQLLCISIPGQ